MPGLIRPIQILRWGLAATLTFVVLLLPLDYFEYYLYDLRMALRPSPTISSLIETIYIDPMTIQDLRGSPTLQDHIRFLKNLVDEKPKAIVYLVNPSDLSGSDDDKRQFVGLTKKFNGFYYVSEDFALRGEIGKLDLPGPFREIRVLSGPITLDLKMLAQDGVTRRMILAYQGKISLHSYLASQIIPERAIPEKIRGEFELYEAQQSYINMAPTMSFPRISFAAVSNLKYELNRFQDKIIFVGTDLGQSSKEYIKTPYSRKVTAMTAVEAHANILNTLIQNSGPLRVPNWINTFVLFIMIILSLEVVLAMKPIRGLTVLGLSLFVFTIASFIAYWPFGLWFNMAHPIIGVFITYYFLIPYRLIIENRRSWELYQKNKLLTQVEELKTNFIGMMSHDLKTPLARIQGMLEIVGRDKNPLSDDQKNAIKSIQKSTEDLLNFISSILNFSRLESQGVQLNLKTKDINIIIEEVIAKCTHLASEKNIKIVMELEPLFSIKMDIDLIRQVLMNLIENAIKYSPNNTIVRVVSEEKEGLVRVSILDQGIGIPEDEKPRLFMKFFRSRNAKNSPIKGSGLGLYLSKYFIELHKGTLTAESKENVGSTFTVYLPTK